MKTFQFFAIVILLSFAAAPKISTADEPNFPICKFTAEQSCPAVGSNYVVWQDTRNGLDIYRNDPGNPSNTDGIAVCTASSYQKFPAISGGMVVWQDQRVASFDIYRYPLPSGPETAITTAAKQETPAISGDIIVWQENGDIYGRRISDGTPLTICTAVGFQGNPAISGNLVVWQDYRNDDGSGSNGDIYGCTIGGGDFPICTKPAVQQMPAISGNIVVWEDFRNGEHNIDIYGKDISGGEEFIVCGDEYDQKAPAIDANIVVWEDHRKDASTDTDGDIYGCRISGHTASPAFGISTLISKQKNPAISGNFVVWEDYRNNNADIYGAYLPQPVVLTILSPNGGETFIAGKQCEITWQSSGGTLDFVKLEYRTNGGADFTEIAASTENDGSFLWQPLPDVESNQCLVRVSDMSTGGASDTSDAVFTIFQCDAALTADLSGDCRVDFADFAVLSSQWLACGTTFEPGWCP